MFCLFASGPEPVIIPVPPGGVRNRYRVDAVEVIKGPAPPLPKTGWELQRVEAETEVSASAPVLIQGKTGTAQYTDPKAPYAAANGLQNYPLFSTDSFLAKLKSDPEYIALMAEMAKKHRALQALAAAPLPEAR